MADPTSFQRIADKQNTFVPSVAVTLVGEDSRALISSAANSGLMSLPGGGQLCSGEYVATLGLLTAAGRGCCTIIILNCLEQTLTYYDRYIDGGSDLTAPASFDVATEAINPHRIPGQRLDPLNPSAKLYGVGCYQFNEGTMKGSCGALAFTYASTDSAPFIGISWVAPWAASRGSGVTTDIANYASDLSSFYDRTADHGHVKVLDSNATTKIKMSCHLAEPPNRYLPSRKTSLPACGDIVIQGLVLTVAVEPIP